MKFSQTGIRSYGVNKSLDPSKTIWLNSCLSRDRFVRTLVNLNLNFKNKILGLVSPSLFRHVGCTKAFQPHCSQERILTKTENGDYSKRIKNSSGSTYVPFRLKAQQCIKCYIVDSCGKKSLVSIFQMFYYCF